MGGRVSKSEPGVLDHPSHLLGRAACSGDDDVALVFAALVVHDDDKLSARYGCDGAFQCVECESSA